MIGENDLCDIDSLGFLRFALWLSKWALFINSQWVLEEYVKKKKEEEYMNTHSYNRCKGCVLHEIKRIIELLILYLLDL